MQSQRINSFLNWSPDRTSIEDWTVFVFQLHCRDQIKCVYISSELHSGPACLCFDTYQYCAHTSLPIESDTFTPANSIQDLEVHKMLCTHCSPAHYQPRKCMAQAHGSAQLLGFPQFKPAAQCCTLQRQACLLLRAHEESNQRAHNLALKFPLTLWQLSSKLLIPIVWWL